MTVAGDEEDRISDSIKGVKWMPGVGEMRESKVETNAPSVHHRHSCHLHTTCRSVNLCHARLPCIVSARSRIISRLCWVVVDMSDSSFQAQLRPPSLDWVHLIVF